MPLPNTAGRSARSTTSSRSAENFHADGNAHGRPHVSLKSDPETSLLNQQIYRGVEPGYHLNKKHWISLYGTEDITPELVADLIRFLESGR
jgi:predicted DNA-binding protein (MmcQ/YjbR family)